VDVLIVGAGPTGLTSACELPGRGIAVQVVDKSDGPATTSGALRVETHREVRARERPRLMDEAERMRRAGDGLVAGHRLR
jgi:2-polyprenyl-6-methoxyphenol hydroxylase-like FAD-dependent oxidoreductase